MPCNKRQRLFENYYDQVSICFALLKKPTKWGWFIRDDAKAYQAVVAAEDARLALEEHEREHGCGKLPWCDPGQAGPTTRLPSPRNKGRADGPEGIPLSR
jgi:hypothetical protein